MLHTPSHPRRASSLPTVLIVLACAATACYLAFFRGKITAHPPAVEKAPAVAESRQAYVEPPPAIKPAAAPAGAPEGRPEPVKFEPKVEPKPEPKVEAPKAPPPSPTRGAIDEINALAAEGRLREARARIAPLFVSALSDAERQEVARKAMQINKELLLDKVDEKEVELYEVRQGDTLAAIANKFKALNGVKGSIMLLHNFKENVILRDGRKLKIAKGTWSVVADKTLFALWICYEGAPFKQYRITIGSTSKETPVAKFTVGGKNPKPAWWPPADMKVTGKVPVPYGDPQNPLGDWWVALDHDNHNGIGIHGTNDPGAMGTKASNGCLRMLNEEVGDVANLAYKGMVVTVVE